MRVMLLGLLGTVALCGAESVDCSTVRSQPCTEGAVSWCGTCLDVTGATDASVAIQECVDAAQAHQRTAYKIEFPAGSTLLLETGLEVSKSIHFDFFGSQVLVGGGVTAFNFGQDAGWSKVENVELRTALNQLTPDPDAVGFDMAHGVRLENIYCGLLGTCVLADSTGELNAGGAYKNVNNIQVREFRASNCGTAVEFKGSDANVGFLYGLEITACDTPIFDESSYGNHVFGAYIEVNKETGIVSTSLVNQSVYNAVILENTPHSTIPSQLSLIVGGNLAKDLTGDTRAEAVGFQHGYLAFQNSRGDRRGPRLQIGSARENESMHWTWVEKGERNRIAIGYDEPAGEWVFGWYGGGLYDESKPFQIGGGQSDHPGNYQLGVEGVE